MKKTSLRAVLVLLLWVVAPIGVMAQSLEVYRLGAPKFADISTLPMYSAQNRGSFTAAGIDFKVISLKTAAVNAALASDEIDGHIFLAPSFVPTMRAIEENQQPTSCTKMVLAMTSSIPAGLMSAQNKGTIESLANSTMAVGILNGLHQGLLRYEFSARDVQGVTYVAAGRTLERLNTVGKSTAATFVYQPFLGIRRRTTNLNVLFDVGAFVSFPGDGLVVRCDAFDPARADLHRRVIEVLVAEAAWLRDPANKDEAIAMIQREMGIRTAIGKFSPDPKPDEAQTEQMTAEISAEIYEQYLAVGAYRRVSDDSIVRAIEIITGGKPSDISSFVDQRWVR